MYFGMYVSDTQKTFLQLLAGLERKSCARLWLSAVLMVVFARARNRHSVTCRSLDRFSACDSLRISWLCGLI